MRTVKSIANIVCLAALLLTAAACKPGVPDEYIQPGEMEDILYDYHLAMAMADEGDVAGRPVREAAYKQAVLKKYGYSEGEVRASMQYYMRHTERLHKIYDNLAERLNDQAKELGAGGTNLSAAALTQNGDTANVWTGSTAVVLMPEPGFNSYAFDIKADTTFHKGDRLVLEFNSNYIIQEGARNAVAVLAVTLGNDSVANRVVHITSDSHMQAPITDNLNDGIKALRGYFMFPRENSMLPTTTVKILCIDHIQLVRMHAPKPQKDNLTDGKGGAQAIEKSNLTDEKGRSTYR